MPNSFFKWFLTKFISGVSCQDSDEELSQEKKLCQDKSAGELFRLKAGKDACRDVIQCTAAVRSLLFISSSYLMHHVKLSTLTSYCTARVDMNFGCPIPTSWSHIGTTFRKHFKIVCFWTRNAKNASWYLTGCSVSGTSSHQVPPRPGFWFGKTNLWLEVGCEKLW